MTIFTGIKPTGDLTLGNYIGAILNFDKSIENADTSFLCIVDLHSITNGAPDPKELNETIKKSLAMYIALDFHKKTNVFIQSHVPEHTQLSWILTCFTKNGELDRMTQYKDKKDNNTSTGLYTYPILMAADILLYNTTHVPVGIDQKQHVEICRDIAQRFNNYYNKETFVLAEPVVEENFQKIYSLTDPTKKMSKSEDNPKSSVSLFDTPKQIEKKIKSAVTDSLGVINYDPENQPGVSNLLTIYSALKRQDMDETLNYFKGQQYGFLKSEVAKIVIEELEPIQRRYYEIRDNEVIFDEVLKQGTTKAREIASKKIKEVYDTVGFL